MSQEEAEKLILSLGNTYGVAEVDTSDLKVEKVAEQSTMYTVQKGDTLWKIAEKHHGKGKGA
jgi:LysM repeat protein